MIDIHTHLLPGVDDGSSSIPQTIEQLTIMSQAGVKTVYLTPHFMRNLYHNAHDVITPVFNDLKQEVKGLDIELVLGCEFFIDNHAAETIQQEELTLGDSNYVLFESMLQQLPADIFEQTYQLQKAGYKLIMAHPEWYTDIIRKSELVEDFLVRDIYLQINAGSLMGMYGRNVQHTAFNLLEKGFVHFIASDNHGDQQECVQQIAYQLVSENFSDKIAEELFINNPARIATDDKIELINHWRLPAKPKSIWSIIKTFFTGYE
ncbi:MAG: CpsB/CapC family capsule biosynthesis tyrosine phosphatase [Candidatus Stygibacter frigidus]|nr:CpsB/CapC family capsule biosynthesis tyrosine phosphatase [Candidatus Stygibacter frigidus]